MQNTSIDLTKLQQGKLLLTKSTERLSERQKSQYQYEESLRMFSNFTAADMGRSRNLIATFQNPEDCKTFIDNYNAMIDEIYALQKQKVFVVVGQSPISNFIVKIFDNRKDAEKHIINLKNTPNIIDSAWYIEEHDLCASSHLL